MSPERVLSIVHEFQSFPQTSGSKSSTKAASFFTTHTGTTLINKKQDRNQKRTHLELCLEIGETACEDEYFVRLVLPGFLEIISRLCVYLAFQ